MEKNKIYLGDSYELIKKLPDKSVDCIYTDVPYLMQSGGKGGGAFGDRIHNLIRQDMRDIINGFDYKILDDYVRVLKKINIFIWCNKQQILEIMTYFKEYSCEILVWGKPNATPFTNNVWLSDLEYCLYFREKGVFLNDDYFLKSKYHIEPTNKKDKDLYDHPTIKPLELVKRHLLHATQKDDVVLDTFLGSGTTAVACKAEKFDYIGCEIDADYVKISEARIKAETVHYDIFDFLEEK